MKRYLLAPLGALGLLALAGCDSDPEPTAVEQELDRLKAATAPLRTLAGAAAAGYTVQATDYYPHMGIHYLNPDLLDDRFEVERPEILVFASVDGGEMTLVAAE